MSIAQDFLLRSKPSSRVAQQNEEISNPFDMLSAPGEVTQTTQPSISFADDAPVAAEDESPVRFAPAPATTIEEDPTSLPVANFGGNVVDTMANYGAISAVGNAELAPIDWGGYGMVRTPNPVADVLLHEECVQGLWDGYSAQRAAECSKMWSRLTAQKKCRKCGGKGCCNECDGAVNRYTQSCDNCSQCAQ